MPADARGASGPAEYAPTVRCPSKLPKGVRAATALPSRERVLILRFGGPPDVSGNHSAPSIAAPTGPRPFAHEPDCHHRTPLVASSVRVASLGELSRALALRSLAATTLQKRRRIANGRDPRRRIRRPRRAFIYYAAVASPDDPRPAGVLGAPLLPCLASTCWWSTRPATRSTHLRLARCHRHALPPTAHPRGLPHRSYAPDFAALET